MPRDYQLFDGFLLLLLVLGGAGYLLAGTDGATALVGVAIGLATLSRLIDKAEAWWKARRGR